MTMAFLSIREASWFGYETALTLCDMLFAFVFARSDGRTPSIAGLTRAFTCTLTDFSTEMLQTGASLAALVKNKGAWTHFWKDVDYDGNGARVGLGRRARERSAASGRGPHCVRER